jgi:acetoacetate decarboxylase
MVQFTKKSMLDGVERTIELPLTEAEFQLGFYRWHEGEYIQDAFPTLTPAQREFIKTGITDEQWEQVFELYDE